MSKIGRRTQKLNAKKPSVTLHFWLFLAHQIGEGVGFFFHLPSSFGGPNRLQIGLRAL
jgi:hypothetical protein